MLARGGHRWERQMDTKELFETMVSTNKPILNDGLELLKSKKERDEIIGFAIESDENNALASTLLYGVLRLAGEGGDTLGVASSATSLAIVKWTQDEKDGEIDGLLEIAETAQPDYSLLDLAKQMRKAGFEAETVKNAIEIAMAM